MVWHVVVVSLEPSAFILKHYIRNDQRTGIVYVRPLGGLMRLRLSIRDNNTVFVWIAAWIKSCLSAV